MLAVANAGLLPAPAPAALVHQQATLLHQPTALLHQPAAIVQQRYIQQAPLVQQIHTPVLAKQVDDEYDPNPQYSYSYDIHVSSNGKNII